MFGPVLPANIGIRAVIPFVIAGNDVGRDFVAPGKELADRCVIGLGEFTLPGHVPGVDVPQMYQEFGGFCLVFLVDVMADCLEILTVVRAAAHRGKYQQVGFLGCHAATAEGGKANDKGSEHRLREAIV